MQQQAQLVESPDHAPADVSITFSVSAHCKGAFNESKVREEVLRRILSLGRAYYGEYRVGVGDLARLDTIAAFCWKAFDPKQRGLGFVLGETSDGSVLFPARCFALQPPSHVDLQEMHGLLSDRRVVVSRRPSLVSVLPVSPPKAPANVALPAVGASALATALFKAGEYAKQRQQDEIECTALQIEIKRLEAELALQPNLDALVEGELRKLGLLT